MIVFVVVFFTAVSRWGRRTRADDRGVDQGHLRAGHGVHTLVRREAWGLAESQGPRNEGGWPALRFFKDSINSSINIVFDCSNGVV